MVPSEHQARRGCHPVATSPRGRENPFFPRWERSRYIEAIRSPTASPLVGRTEHLHRLRALCAAARNGASGAVVLHGAPGIGKSSLLEHAADELDGIRIERITGYGAESTFAYAGLQRLGMPFADRIREIPAPQQQALRIAAGIVDGPAPEPFLVGLATLSLLAASATEEPVLCLIDDAHLLDPETLTVIAFVARRLRAESVVLVLATRTDPETDPQLAGLPHLRVDGLDLDAAIELLAQNTAAPIDRSVAVRIVDQTAGNPLALLDLAHDFTAQQLIDASLTIAPPPVGPRLEAHYLAQFAQLTPSERLWLLVAAAESTGEIELIEKAALSLGIATGASSGAEQARLVDVRGTVVFRHPLIRSAVYGGMPAHDRLRVHAALRDAASAAGHGELALWHAAEATAGVDETVARALEEAGDGAGSRGGLVSRARLLARAAELTPDATDRNDRLLAAAESACSGGAVQLAADLLTRLESRALTAVGRGRALTVEALVCQFLPDRGGVARSPLMLLDAAAEFHGHDPELEQRTLVRAFEFSLTTESLMEGVTLAELGRRLEAGRSVHPGPLAVVLRGLSALILRPYPAAVGPLRAAADLIREQSDDDLLDLGFVGVAPLIALWELDECFAMLERIARVARERGSLRMLDAALWIRGVTELLRGDPASSGNAVAQVRELRAAMGFDADRIVNAGHLAWTGAPRDQLSLVEDGLRALGYGGPLRIAAGALGIREIAEGRYDEAYARISALVADPYAQASFHLVPELVEAALRSGHRPAALSATGTMRTFAEASPTPWSRGMLERCLALTADEPDAEAHYAASLVILDSAGWVGEAARAHLLYGEWLRRRRRRRDAREHLRSAYAAFTQSDAVAFAERARRELASTGETVTPAAVAGSAALTPQESAIALRAARGDTNAEIGAGLFISPNTVDYHLRKVYRKLEITSRRQLADRLAQG